tara:strand:+ start:1249 stop:1719 length:471 start_codon:yes stop_codon:yes gene_type:complete
MKSLLLKLNRRDEILLFLIFVFLLLTGLVLLNSKLNSIGNESELDFQKSKIYFQEMQLSLQRKEKIQSYDDSYSQNSASIISSLARSKNLSIDRIQPINDNSYIVTVNNGDFISLFSWIKDLEEKSSISITKASLKRSTSNPSNKIRAQVVLTSSK